MKKLSDELFMQRMFRVDQFLEVLHALEPKRSWTNAKNFDAEIVAALKKVK